MGRPAKLELDEVLNRGTDLLWRQGVDAVSTRDLEAALDLRAPAIYRRFGNKDGLVASCLDHYVDTVIEARVRRLLDRAEDPMRGLYTFFTSTIDPHGREPRRRGCLLANTATSAKGQVPEVRAVIRRGWTIMDAAFRRQIRRAQQAGQLVPDLDPGAVSQSLLISLQGLLTLVRAGLADPHLDLREGIDVTFRGLGWEPSASTCSLRRR